MLLLFILTIEGIKPIEGIKAGDLVYSTNPETGESEYKEVVQTFENEAKELVHISIGDDEITTTPKHPFYVPHKGWTSAVDLRAGNILVLSNGEYVIVEKVQHEILESPVKVYNFEVHDFHTYYVGENSLLVHNSCTRENGQYHVYETYNLDSDYYYSSDAVQFRQANKQFKENLLRDADFRHDMYRRHPELADWVENGNMSRSPTGFTWHHSEEPGVLQLVDRIDHNQNHRIYHPSGVGGRNIWGGGKAGRQGKLNMYGQLK